MIAEYNNSGTMLRRYAHGSNVGPDKPLIWYEGASQSASLRRYRDFGGATASLLERRADPRGSIVAVTDHTGNRIATNSYDEFGIPDTASGNDIATKGRFRYTGQAWIPQLGMYYYKARIYSPTLGRFLQTDPIGYDDGMNIYAYVGNDPINGVDPTGESCRKADKGGYVCKVDDRKSFLKAGWSSAEIAKFEASYTKAVNTLLANPENTVTVDYANLSFDAKSGDIANNLIETWVQADANPRPAAVANMDGGPGTLTRGHGAMRSERDLKKLNPGRMPFIMSVSRLSRDRSDTATQITIVHEGLHTAKGHGVFNGTGYIRGSGHREAFNRAARVLLGLPSQ